MASDIRLATRNDATGIAKIYRPIVESTPISFETEPPDEHEIQRRVVETLPSYPWLVCEHESRVAGYAYATRHRARAAYQWSVDTSVYVRSDFRRRGIGQGLYASLIRILTAQGYFHAYAGIALPNPGSVGLHESVGFKAIGVYRNVGYKLGAWHDVGWWELALQPPVASPRPAFSIAQIQDDPSWQGCWRRGLRVFAIHPEGGTIDGRRARHASRPDCLTRGPSLRRRPSHSCRHRRTDPRRHSRKRGSGI